MDILSFLSFEFFALATVMLIVLTILVAKTGHLLRLVLVALFALHLPLLYIGLVNLLGQGKPVAWETRKLKDKAEVIAYDFEVDKAIYIWVRLPGEPSPRYYVMQWDTDMVRRMTSAQETAQQRQTGVVMEMTETQTVTPEGYENQVEPIFYAQPQPPMPPKPYRH